MMSWKEKEINSKRSIYARMVKQVDTRDLKSLAARCAGSIPASGTIDK